VGEGRDDTAVPYLAIVNDEEQYSLWPDGRPIPAGWRNAGVTGARTDCLAFIEGVWTDLRPLSLRNRMN
jgi:MbtH protein